MVLPHPGPKNIGSLVTTTGLVPDPGGTILQPVTDFAQRTIDLARRNVAEGGRPSATVIVKDGEVLAETANKVAQTDDPTAHVEILAIREACLKLGTEHLVDTTIYLLAHPCPMSLGSLYYRSPREVISEITRESYERYYLDDRKYFEVSTFRDEFAKSWDQRRLPMPRDSAVDVYRFWNQRNGGERKIHCRPTRLKRLELDSTADPFAIICVCRQVKAKVDYPTSRPVWSSRFSGCWLTPPACRCCGR